MTPIICVFHSANFPQEKYFSPSNHFFPKKPIFGTLIQSIVTRFSEKTHSQPERWAGKSAKMHITNVLVVYYKSSVFEVRGKLSLISLFPFLYSFLYILLYIVNASANSFLIYFVRKFALYSILSAISFKLLYKSRKVRLLSFVGLIMINKCNNRVNLPAQSITISLRKLK